MAVDTINTIREERQAIKEALQGVAGITNYFDYDPKQIGPTPALTIAFMGIAEPESANFRQAKQVRLYDIMVYVGLEDSLIAQDQLADLIVPIWEKCVSMLNLGDPETVIFTTVGETSVDWVADEAAGKSYVRGKIRVTTQHRSNYC